GHTDRLPQTLVRPPGRLRVTDYETDRRARDQTAEMGGVVYEEVEEKPHGQTVQRPLDHLRPDAGAHRPAPAPAPNRRQTDHAEDGARGTDTRRNRTVTPDCAEQTTAYAGHQIGDEVAGGAVQLLDQGAHRQQSPGVHQQMQQTPVQEDVAQ